MAVMISEVQLKDEYDGVTMAILLQGFASLDLTEPPRKSRREDIGALVFKY
jgi:hypothetical protein